RPGSLFATATCSRPPVCRARWHTVSVAGSSSAPGLVGETSSESKGCRISRSGEAAVRRKADVAAGRVRPRRSVVGAAGAQAVEQDGDDDEAADEGALPE